MLFISSRPQCINGMSHVRHQTIIRKLMVYRLLDHWEQILETWIQKNKMFKKINFNISSAKRRPFCLVFNVLNMAL